MSIPDTRHHSSQLARTSASKNTLTPPGLEVFLRVLQSPRTPDLRVRLADRKRPRVPEEIRRSREGEVETRPARACEMCKENQRVLPFRSREACDVSFFAFPCNRNLRLHNIHDKKK
jgi:hypothetical protein